MGGPRAMAPKDGPAKEITAVWPSVNGEGLNQEMQDHAIKLAKDGLQLCKDECELAAYMKKGFDSQFHPTWQAIVGRTLGSGRETASSSTWDQEICFLTTGRNILD